MKLRNSVLYIRMSNDNKLIDNVVTGLNIEELLNIKKKCDLFGIANKACISYDITHLRKEAWIAMDAIADIEQITVPSLIVESLRGRYVIYTVAEYVLRRNYSGLTGSMLGEQCEWESKGLEDRNEYTVLSSNSRDEHTYGTCRLLGKGDVILSGKELTERIEFGGRVFTNNLDDDTVEIQVKDLPNSCLLVKDLVKCKKLVLGTDKLPAEGQVLIENCPNLERADILRINKKLEFHERLIRNALDSLGSVKEVKLRDRHINL